MEVRVALDTNRLTDLFQGDSALAEVLATCNEVWFPLIVLAEIKAGFYGGEQRVKQLKRAGAPVPDNDPRVAALALQHHLRLIMRDKRFKRIPQLLP